jgi:hypothetical protein
VVAADGTHPIFNGPFTPAGTSFTGDHFGHSLIQGPDLTPLILRRANDDPDPSPGDPNAIVLAQYCSGPGITLIGGMTMPEFHSPSPNGENLRGNIVHYTANTTQCSGEKPPPPVVTPSPPAPVRDSTAPRVRVAGLRTRGCVSRNFRIRVRTRESALKLVTVSLDGRRIAKSRRTSFAVRIRARKLRTGSHRLRIAAVDTAGNRRTVRRRFTRCAVAARPRVRVRPRFTG